MQRHIRCIWLPVIKASLCITLKFSPSHFTEMIRWNYITKYNPQNSGAFIRHCLFWTCLAGQQLTQLLCHEWGNVRCTDLNFLPDQQELETECTDLKITLSELWSFSNEQPYWSREMLIFFSQLSSSNNSCVYVCVFQCTLQRSFK